MGSIGTAIYILCFITIAFCAKSQGFNTITGSKRSDVPLFQEAESYNSVEHYIDSIDTAPIFQPQILKLSYRRNTSLPLRQIRITSAYGQRVHPLSGFHRFHSGVDLAARQDTIFAIFDGTVTNVSNDANLGINVQLDHAGEMKSIYGHMSHILTATGQTISSGQAIGITGNTGLSTGEHLHFTVKKDNRLVDPMLVLKYLIDSELNYQAMDVINSAQITR